MRRKFLLPAFAACAMLVVGAPAASASKAHVSASNTAKAITFLLSANKQKGSDIGALKDQVTGLTAAVKSIHDGLDPIVAAAPSILAGFTAINSALTNTTTGLVGLNLARPQFGAFNADGTIIAGTGQVTGASGPSGAAIHNAPGKYIVDFGDNVSQRFLIVNMFPSSGNPPIAQVVDCASNSTAGATCHALGDPTVGNPNHVLVTVEGIVGPAATDDPFSVAAISG